MEQTPRRVLPVYGRCRNHAAAELEPKATPGEEGPQPTQEIVAEIKRIPQFGKKPPRLVNPGNLRPGIPESLKVPKQG
jgi:hypothetical protein